MILENLISELESIISQSLKRAYVVLNRHLLENRWPPIWTQIRTPTSRLIGHDVLFNINTRNYHPETVVDIGGTLDIVLPNVGLELTANIAGTNVNIYVHPPNPTRLEVVMTDYRDDLTYFHDTLEMILPKPSEKSISKKLTQ